MLEVNAVEYQEDQKWDLEKKWQIKGYNLFLLKLFHENKYNLETIEYGSIGLDILPTNSTD